jgi:hypothetical protein
VIRTSHTFAAVLSTIKNSISFYNLDFSYVPQRKNPKIPIPATVNKLEATFIAAAEPLAVALAPLPAVVALPLAVGPEGVAVADPDPFVELVVVEELALAVPFAKMAQIFAGIAPKATISC